MHNTPEPGPTVFIVDDDDAVGDGIKLLLRSVKLPCQRLRSAQEFLDNYRPGAAGCVLLDVRMPGMSGLELQREMGRRGIALPIIFMTGHGDVQMAVEAMRQGAMDFLQKPFREEELLQKIRAALARDAESRAGREQREASRRLLETLTPREREIAGRVARGQANKVVAAELGLSQRTVEVHRARVMEKLQVRSVAELVKVVLAAGGE